MKKSVITDRLRSVSESTTQFDFLFFAKESVRHMLMFLGGVLMASVNDFGTLSPFGVAFCTAVGQKYIISSSLGAAAGYILTQDSVTSLRYIAAIICAAILTRLMCEFEKAAKFRLLPSCIAFFTLFVSSMVVLFAGDIEMRAFLLYTGEAALGFASSWFFGSAFGIAAVYKKQGGLTGRDMGNAAITTFLFLSSLAGITLFQISFARIAAVMLILIFSYIFREAGGAVTGVSATLVLSMNSNVGAVGMAYAVSGLMSGIFAHMNRYIGAGVFLLAFGIAFIFGEGTAENINLLCEAVIACVIFMAVPEKYIVKIENLLVIHKEPQTADAQRQVILNRLKSASAAVGEMSETITIASDILKPEKITDTSSVYARVRSQVCDNCRLNDFCWSRNFTDCKQSFDTMNEILKNNGMINLSNVPQYISGCCVRLNDLTESFNKSYISFVATTAAQDKIEKIRQVTGEQFGGICSMLSELSEEFSKGISFDNLRTKRIEEMLINEYDIDASSVVCLTDSNGHIRVEFSAKELPKSLRENELKQSLETVCAGELDMPVIIKNNNGVSVCFCSKTAFRVEASASRIVADCEKLSGDSFESFYDGRGNYTVILSDGMGTGVRAAIDSSIAGTMMAKLLKSGFSHNSSLRLVNSALLLKSKDESLATLDILNIDLYTGNAEFYKAGAAPSYIKRKNKMLEIRKASMPVGILRETEFATASGTLNAGDTVIIASDGAFEYAKDAVRNTLAITVSESVEEVSEMIAHNAKKEKGENRCDDITVIAVRLVTNR